MFYNNSFQYHSCFAEHCIQSIAEHSEYCLRVLPSDVLFLQLEKGLSVLLWLLA